LDRDKLRAVRSLGINRISIGIQSFNDDELKQIGRTHSSEEAAEAVCIARDAGFQNIGIDLIYGIPGQSAEIWEKTLSKAVELRPSHISAYGLTVENGTLLSKYVKEGKMKLSGDERIIKMYDRAIDHLTSEGYKHYEISNFAMQGCLCLHNLNYWEMGDYYGLGLGAHSYIRGRRSYNTDGLDNYIKTVHDKGSSVAGFEDLTAEKAFSESIFLGLRKTGGINLKTFAERSGKDIRRLYRKEIKELQEAGLIEISGLSGSGCDAFMRLTRKGILLSNEVFIRFM
jgi:oxygen-independent coproporphyrinogen-3 oxidase